MRNVLADLAVEAEAATIVAMRMAGATDSAVRGDERETLLRRIGLAAGKYWVCKRATAHAAEAMECLGGNGYVEESGMPRLYREAPLMGIWEGSGNVSALDTLRAMATRPECVDVLFDELAKTTGQDPRLDAHVDGAQAAAGRPRDHPVPGPQGRRGHQPRAAGLAAGAARPSGRRRSVPRHPDGRPVGRRLRHHARRDWISRRSSSGRWSRDDPRCARDQARRLRQPEDDDLRGHRPGCANHVQPPRKRQRDHRRHPAGAVRARRARRPRPRRPRHPGVGPRAKGSAPASTCRPTPRARRRRAAAARMRTPCCPARRRPSTICPISRGIR